MLDDFRCGEYKNISLLVTGFSNHFSPTVFTTMTGITKTTKQTLSHGATRSLHSLGWRLNGGGCFGQTPNSSAIFSMPKGRVTSEQRVSDYRLEHQ